MQPELEGLREKGLDFYLIVEGRQDVLRDFFGQYPLSAPVLWDKDLAIFRDYDVLGLPMNFFLDRDGLLVDLKLGWGEDSLRETMELVDMLLAQ
ncbi:MAG: redoxin domain-containing protein [Firmicutes bacterium]|nr:redoxin domain-containing protein [Bacillota bacterium]